MSSIRGDPDWGPAIQPDDEPPTEEWLQRFEDRDLDDGVVLVVSPQQYIDDDSDEAWITVDEDILVDQHDLAEFGDGSSEANAWWWHDA